MGQRERAAFMAQAEGGSKPAQAANKIAHVVAVLSGKGGVGKSSVAALLAVALNRNGKRVGLLDADITGPSQPKMFGLHQQPTMSPLGILPVETETGIKVMSINLLLAKEDQAIIWRGPLISSAIKQFWNEVVWRELDFLVVDLPPGTSDASLTVMQSIPLSGVVLVTSPQDLAGMVVRKAAGMVQRMKAPILGLVENMSYMTCPKCGEKIEVFGPSQALPTATKLGTPFLGRIPLDPELSRYCDAGKIETYDGKAFEPIADQVIARMAERAPLANN
jgi:Mrp family chromosome partitioning ATPase